jgi:phage shock protein C
MLSILKLRGGQMNKLYRSKKNRIIAGVCGGIGEYFKVDPTLIRLLWLLISIVGAGSGIVAYIIAWIIIPKEP